MKLLCLKTTRVARSSNLDGWEALEASNVGIKKSAMTAMKTEGSHDSDGHHLPKRVPY
jgi:hypothetical protein